MLHGTGYQLIIIADDEGFCDAHASEAAARRALPGLTVERVVPLHEHEVGAWLAAQRGRRCRTERDVRSTPERQRAVVIDADLPADAW